jgi:hypothetical protein
MLSKSRALSLIAVLTLTVFSAGVTSVAPVAAADQCSCVTYVKRVNNITTSLGNAKDAGSALTRLGWRRYTPSYYGTRPRGGDIVILQPGVLGANATYGHIGIVGSWSLNSYGDMIFYMRSANWGSSSSWFTDRNCRNVSYVRRPSSGTFRANSTGVAFYRKG